MKKTINRSIKPTLFASAVLCAIGSVPVAAAVSLGSYNVRLQETSTSGISSGAYMAVQFGVAHSSIIKGVGAVAGGPFYCAQGSMTTATSTCMIGNPSITGLINTTNSWATAGTIDPTSNIAKQKIWLFNGYNDGVVKRPVSDALYNYYRNYAPENNIFYKDNTKAAHAQVTDSYGSACDYTGGNFMVNCGYDAAGNILQHIYGKLNPRNTGVLSGSIVEFSQSEFHTGDTWLVGMSHYGFAYVPASCAAQQACRVHIAFHGCKQYATSIGDKYYAKAGYNQWADTNNMIVLYPQTVATTVTPLNPNGCWDWWGLASSNYAKKSSPQITAIRAMLTRLSGSYTGWTPTVAGSFGAPTNVAAMDKTHTKVNLTWTPVNGATGYNVYRGGVKVNATPLAGASFSDVGRTASTAYSYVVKAVNSASTESAASATVNVTTAATPATCDPFVRDNYSHWLEGRADMWYGFDYAKGSGQYMGAGNIYVETVLKKTGTNYFVIGTCA